MNHVMMNVQDVAAKIKNGKNLLLAGDEKLLRDLPNGNWIAGTIPYFMAEEGGVSTTDKIFVSTIPEYVAETLIKTYDENTIDQVYQDAPKNGFSVIIMPATSEVHAHFAMKAPNYPSFGHSPLIGWISGVHLDDLGSVSPKIFDGRSAEGLTDKAAVMHVALPKDKYANIDIVNIFEQGDGDTFTFAETGFSVQDVFINGEKQNFAEYISKNNLDVKLPLVADYCGAMINISFQEVNTEEGLVSFYGSVFKDIKYKQAKPVGDYVQMFTQNMPTESVDNIVFSCNCILNYLYSELEGKSLNGITGPITFGEIAYQLLNQTMTYITIEHDN